MIGISKLYCGAVEPGDVLRYDRDSSKLPSDLLQFSRDKKPVVVWNCTQKCNLKCMRVVISTNGTQITPEKAEEYARVGLSYVGVSLDGGPDTHEHFRRTP